MTNEDIKELHKLIEDYCEDKDLGVPQLLSFLSIALVGTAVMHGYSRNFFDKA